MSVHAPHWMRELSHFILFLSLIALSVVAYFLIRVPSSIPHSHKIHKLWQYISILHGSWLIGCTAECALSGKQLFESLYFFGFLMYLVAGSCILLWICQFISSTINQSSRQSTERKHQMTMEKHGETDLNPSSPRSTGTK